MKAFKFSMRVAQDHVFNCPPPGGEKSRSSKTTTTQKQTEETAINNADTVPTTLSNADVTNRLDKQEEKLEKIMVFLTAMKEEKTAVQAAQPRPTYAQKMKINVPPADKQKANTKNSE